MFILKNSNTSTKIKNESFSALGHKVTTVHSLLMYHYMSFLMKTHAQTQSVQRLFLIFTKIRSLYIVHYLLFKLKVSRTSFHEQGKTRSFKAFLLNIVA